MIQNSETVAEYCGEEEADPLDRLETELRAVLEEDEWQYIQVIFTLSDEPRIKDITLNRIGIGDMGVDEIISDGRQVIESISLCGDREIESLEIQVGYEFETIDFAIR